MAVSSAGLKQQYPLPRCKAELNQSEDEEPTCCSKEMPQWRQKEEDPLAGHLKDACQEAFCQDSALVKQIRWTYFQAHQPAFDREATHDLAHVFKEMAEAVGLMNTNIYQVQDPWQGKKELWAANHTVRSSVKDLQYFQMVSPTKSPKIMGLKRINSPEALKWWSGLLFCSWCGKEGRTRVLCWTISAWGTTTSG